MIKVLFAIPALDRGGPDRVMYELLRALDRRHFAPSLLISSPEGYYRSELPADLPVEILGDDGGLRDRYPLVRVLRFIRRISPNVVVATQRMILTLGIIAPAFRSGTRLVLRQANDFTAGFEALIRTTLVKHRLARQITLASLRRANAIICQSKAMETDLRQLLGARANLHVIGNPIGVDAIAQESGTSTVTVPGCPALVSVGRLAQQKGYDILLAAITTLRDRHPELHLTILGDGPERAGLQVLVREFDLDRSVTFAGFTPEPLPYLRAADLFVLASRYEGLPNAALEALACGTPVVLTDCPGANREILIEGVNGRLAVGNDAHSVSHAIETALSEIRGYDRGRIKADCHERFGVSRIVGEYERLFERIVDPTQA